MSKKSDSQRWGTRRRIPGAQRIRGWGKESERTRDKGVEVGRRNQRREQQEKGEGKKFQNLSKSRFWTQHLYSSILFSFSSLLNLLCSFPHSSLILLSPSFYAVDFLSQWSSFYSVMQLKWSPHENVFNCISRCLSLLVQLLPSLPAAEKKKSSLCDTLFVSRLRHAIIVGPCLTFFPPEDSFSLNHFPWFRMLTECRDNLLKNGSRRQQHRITSQKLIPVRFRSFFLLQKGNQRLARKGR